MRFNPAAAVLRYDRGAMALHWVMAVLIVVVGVLGLLHDLWPRRSQALRINAHALMGIHLLTALWQQFVWRDRLLHRVWPVAAPRARSRP